jgi:hypothetical protein
LGVGTQLTSGAAASCLSAQLPSIVHAPTIDAIAEPAPSITRKPPPDAVLAVINPLVHVVVGTPLGRLLPASMTSLRFTGRRSRRPLKVAVLVHDLDSGPVVFSDRPWRLNFRGGADVTVIRKGRTVRARGELIEDQAVVAPAWQAAIRRRGLTKLGLGGTKGHVPSVGELAGLGESMIRLHL